MSNNLNKKPCVVETPQGFSVSYNEHFLYSKYNPSKLIVSKIENLTLLSGSIILCNSPLLGYGLNELVLKLPENCLLVLCEQCNDLYDFSIEYLSPIVEKNAELFLIPSPDELKKLPLTIFSKCSSGIYKRILRLDFSAGTQFNSEFYNELESACTNAVMTFWKNRLTLTKFGRKYSHNFFENLKMLPKSVPIKNYFGNINQPIIVFGAGQSVDLFFKQNNIDFSKYYVLCADTALIPLLKRKIVPNGVFIEEAQNVISKAFIGTAGAFSKTHLFAGLSSLPLLSKIISPASISYFTTEYTQANFIDSLKQTDFLPPVNSPFGSVGLTTVYYALKFRANDSIPVYTVGLDFSYSAGITHMRGALAHTFRLISSNRINPQENYKAAFNQSTIKFEDKQKNIFFTTPTLQSYALMFNGFFAGTKNLFDSGKCGIPLSILQGSPLPLENIIDNNIKNEKYSENQIRNINTYLTNEKNELLQLKKLLTEKTELSKEELEKEITKKITAREYLFLHFPDGYSFTYSQSFLNRIRTEIDFFIHHHFL